MDSAISDDLLGISTSADQHNDNNNDNYNDDDDQLVQEEQEQQENNNNEQETLQQDEAVTNNTNHNSKHQHHQPQELVIEQPADPLPLLLIKRELAKALAQLNTKAVEVDQLNQELTLTKGTLAEEKKKYEVLALTPINTSSSPDAALQQQHHALAFKKLETVFATAASPTSSANPTFVELVSKSESIVRENLLLQERVDFLENTSKAFKNQALVWRKVASSSSSRNDTKKGHSTTSSSSFHVLDPKSEHHLIAKFPSTPEAAKLKQLCTQVTDLLKERAAVAADEGDWRGVVESLKDGLTNVLTEYETSAKQVVILRSALHRGASYCIEAANEAQDANAIAADASIRSHFVSGVLALKGVNNNNFTAVNNTLPFNNNNSISQDSSSATTLLYYRSLLASLIGNHNNNSATTSTTTTAVPSWQQQQQQALPPTSELAFLRRLVSEYNAKCNQLEQQNRDYKNIALNCANFFSTTTSNNIDSHPLQISSSSNSKNNNNDNNNENNAATAIMNKKVLEMWRSSTFELLKIATEMADKSSTAPFFFSNNTNQTSSSSPSSSLSLSKDISYPVLFAKCSALENQVALQNSTIQALNNISQQLSNLASTSSLWLPSVIEACIPSSSSSSSSHNNDDDNNHNTSQDISSVVADIQSLLSVTQDALNDTITNYDDISEDLRSQYETQIQNLEHWYSHRFDAQRLRTNALIQMVRTSDAIVAEVCGIEQQQQSQQQQFWTKFMSNHNQKFSFLGSRNNPTSVSWISAAFGESASKQQKIQTISTASSSSTSIILEQLEKSVKSITQEFKARRAQMEKKLDFFNTSDDTQLQRQILSLQDQIEATQTNFDKEREEIVSQRDSCANELENKKLECQDWEGKYLELSARYDKMKADAENIMQTLLAEQEKAAKLQQELQEQEELQQQEDEQQPIRHQSIGGASKTSTGGGGGNFVVEEVVEDDDVENDGEEEENIHHNEPEQIPLQEDSTSINNEQQQHQLRKSKSKSKSGEHDDNRNHDQGENREEEEETSTGATNPFASSLF